VFLVEYLGPLLIHPAIYFLRPYIYPYPSISATTIPPPSDLQKLSLALVCAHFVKREFETLFVHRFSSSTMPLRNIFKNSAHYWLLSGLNIAYWTYAPSSPTQTRSASDITTYIGLALFLFGELANLNSHLVLRNLRPSGTTERGIPKGLGFSWVTCPNYLFETMAWAGIWMVNWSLSTGVFLVVAGAQMAVWAQKKERRYRKEFGDKYKKKRYAMLPGLV
jgi:very-long-chain enoyl-CoA reductase